MLGSAVGGLIVVTNARTLLSSDWVDASDSTRWAAYTALSLAWAAAVAWSTRAHRAEVALEAELAALRGEAGGPTTRPRSTISEG